MDKVYQLSDHSIVLLKCFINSSIEDLAMHILFYYFFFLSRRI
jgi:hypothetical protein